MLMVVLTVGLFGWAIIGTFVNTIFGFVIFAGFGGYAYIFLVQNELGENRKQTALKRQQYYKDVQTFVFSRNYRK